jgi:hypothetical protein
VLEAVLVSTTVGAVAVAVLGVLAESVTVAMTKSVLVNSVWDAETPVGVRSMATRPPSVAQ